MEHDLLAQNSLLRKRVAELEQDSINKKTKKIKLRTLDFTKYKMRHIAIKFCYLGWSYCGLVTQLNVENTILEKVYEALEKCKLIENREVSKITVCGRTDKGVSAFEQVISLYVRSNLHEGRGIVADSGLNIHLRKDPCDKEIDFIFLLNKVLPHDIRALKWCAVEEDFSARFSCQSRAYKYIFPKSNLLIERIEDAGRRLIGEHDFRNFCCMQVGQGVTNYVRTIMDFSVAPVDKQQVDDMYNMYVMNIKATAFIYHQIRCIVAVVLMVGQGVEEAGVIDQLLDIDGVGGRGKPQYQMASDLPLVFYEADFDRLEWQVSREAVNDYVGDIERLWTTEKIRESILRLYLSEIEAEHGEVLQRKPLVRHVSHESNFKTRKTLLERNKEPTLEHRIALENSKNKE